MMRWICRTVPGLLALTTLACSQAKYTGVSPSTRTFSEVNAGTKDYYVGLNANFSMDKPGVPQAAAQAAEASKDVSPSKPVGVTPPAASGVPAVGQ